MLFRILITYALLVGTLQSVGYAGEAATSIDFNQFEQATFLHEVHFHPSSNVVECQEEQKSDCQSKFLLQELVEEEKISLSSTSSYSLLRTSLVQPQGKFLNKEFLKIEIYVDRVHRNFEAEILEIFDQSLVLETEQSGTPIMLECYCDDRGPHAYSFILGHRWGSMIESSLHNLASHSPAVELVNYGKEFDLCDKNMGDCQEGSRLQATFRFLAIRESRSGCLIRLRLPVQRNIRQMVLVDHPLFLQEIHVAGTKFKSMP